MSESKGESVAGAGVGVAGLLRLVWDRLVALVAIAAGGLALILGWVGVSGEAFLAKQLPFLISGGIGGLFLLGLGALFWLSADLRDEWTELVRIERALERITESAGDHVPQLRLLTGSRPRNAQEQVLMDAGPP